MSAREIVSKLVALRAAANLGANSRFTVFASGPTSRGDGPRRSLRRAVALEWTDNSQMDTLKRFLGSLRYGGGQAAGHHWSTKWVHWTAAALLAYAGNINGEAVGAP